jgi:hypothetical protein
MTSLHDQIIEWLVSEFYDQPIMSNLTRPHYVERMIALGLANGWKLVSANWSGWDIENSEGVRIEVKQSAARQVWTDLPSFQGKPTKGAFDIAPRTGYWADDGSTWVKTDGRVADIYIFAWHPVFDKATADQRDPAQWKFYVVPEQELPTGQKTIGLNTVTGKWRPVGFEMLPQRVSAVVSGLPVMKASIEEKYRGH